MGIPIKNIFLTDLNFSRTPNIPEKINFTYTINVGAKMNESNIGQVNVKLEVLEKDADSFKLSCCMVGLFDLSGLPNSSLSVDDFLYINAPAIIFPYLRETVSNTTIRANMPPLIIPTFNFKDMREQKKKETIKQLETEDTKLE